MEEMKKRFSNAVSNKLSAAPDSTAKAELMEELSDNLYRRYLDMTASGVGEGEAFERALDELGDAGELVDYLKSLAPDEALPQLTLSPDEDREDDGWPGKDELNDLIDSVGEIVQGAMDKAGNALRQAKEALDQAGRSGSWSSSDGSFTFRFSGREGSETRSQVFEDPGEAGTAQAEDAGARIWFDDSEDAYAIDDHDQPLRGVDVETVNGDVTIHLVENGSAIRVSGDVEQLEVKITDSGVLAIRQGRTASSTFFFLRGLSSADVELYLPRRRWEFIQVSAVNGDVELDEALELDRLSVKTVSGDLRADSLSCGQLYFKSASGDMDLDDFTGSASAESMSGNLSLEGSLGHVRLSSTSGDVEAEGSVRDGRLSSVSGDVRVESDLLPERMELSSKSGDCEARIPDAGPFTLRFKTTSGEFHSNFPLRRTSQGAIYGDGGERTYSMTSISGDLELSRY